MNSRTKGDGRMLFSEQPLFRYSAGIRTRWSNVNNVSGDRGRAGRDVRPLRLDPGQKMVLCEFDGPGIIDRFWFTMDWPGKDAYPDSMLRNRSVRIECYWEDSPEPAVCAPVGDLFCRPLCYDIPFENAFFEDPSGRSGLCFVPMPFRKKARIEVYNEFTVPITVFHAVSLRQGIELLPEDGYFHAVWRRSLPDSPGTAHEVLPEVQGRGRYLGSHLGLLSDPCNPLDWHLAPMRFYLDGEKETAGMMTPSMDDYSGSSWDYDRTFTHQDSGLLLSRYFPEGGGHHAFYIYHRRDPLLFSESCRVTLQPGYGGSINEVLAALEEDPSLAERITLPAPLDALRRQQGEGGGEWMQGGRMDDVSSLSLLYLDSPDGTGHSQKEMEKRCAAGWNWPIENGLITEGVMQ